MASLIRLALYLGALLPPVLALPPGVPPGVLPNDDYKPPGVITNDFTTVFSFGAPVTLTDTTAAPTETSAVPTDTSSSVPTDTSSSVPTQTSSSVPADTSSSVPADTSSDVPTKTSSDDPIYASSAIPTSTVSVIPESEKAEIIPDSYIVMLKDGIFLNSSSHLAWVAELHRRSISGRNLKGVEMTYNISTLHGYSGEFDNETISEIKASPDVASVIPDYVMHLYGGQKTHTDEPRSLEKRWKKTQKDAEWGLASISHRVPGKRNYLYDSSAGSGTYAYILDSGLQTTHKDFGSRASTGYNALYDGNEDRVGHGTHAAGIIGSKTFGVAKKAKLISVKVFGSQVGSAAHVLDGFAWAVNDIASKRRTRKAVINMSLGGPHNALWTAVVDAAYKKGILCVVAAGNGDARGNPMPVSMISPANAMSAFTVSAVTPVWRAATFANYGPEVDIFAPGLDVMSTYIGDSNRETEILDGTSMAAPYVTGLALYLMSKENLKNPDAVKARIIQLATKGSILGKLYGSPNVLAFNGITKY